MRKSEGSKGIALIECINPYIGKYRIRWDIQPKVTEDENSELVTFYETDLTKKGKLSLQDVRNAVLTKVNEMVDEQILSGFVWKDMPIWLSSENQFNYKAAYDLTLQSGGQTLPVLFKFGTMENPIYHKFETIEELSEFYVGAMKYISDTLSLGWTMKDSVNWNEYEEVLNTLK